MSLNSLLDGVEKAAETVVEVVEKVAEVAEKVATDIANALPANSKLREEVMEVEHFAEGVEKYAEKADEFIHKVLSNSWLLIRLFKLFIY